MFLPNFAPKYFKIVTMNENDSPTILVQKKKNRGPVYGQNLTKGRKKH